MAPADLLKSLLAMQKSGFMLPDIAPNEIGLSIVTSWLHERFARLCSVGYRSEVPAADMGAHVVELFAADNPCGLRQMHCACCLLPALGGPALTSPN